MVTYDLSCMPCCGGGCCPDLIADNLCACITASGGCATCYNNLCVDLTVDESGSVWEGTQLTNCDPPFDIDSVTISFSWDTGTCTGLVEVTCDAVTDSVAVGRENFTCSYDEGTEQFTFVSLTVSLAVTGCCSDTITITITSGTCP